MTSRARSDSQTDSWSRGCGIGAVVVEPAGVNRPVVASFADMLSSFVGSQVQIIYDPQKRTEGGKMNREMPEQ